MELVGAALGHQIDLRAGGAALVGVCETGDYAEFLYRVQGFAQNASKGIAAGLVIVVRAVDGHISLVGAYPVHRARAAVAVLVDVMAQIEDAGLQAQQVRDIAVLHRQRLDGGVVDGAAQAWRHWCSARSPPR